MTIGILEEVQLRILLAVLTTLILCNGALSAELFGKVDALSGSAYVKDQTGKSSAVSVGQSIYEGQTINSGPDGEVHLVTEDGGIIAVRPNTVFRIDEYKADGNSTDKIFMSLLKGAVRSITGWVGKFNTAAYRITTPTATIGIRGTDHETTVIDNGNGDEPGTYDSVNEGSTVLRTPQGTADVTPGKYAFAARGRAAAPVFLARRPHFLATRRLIIEERIQRRKEFFRTRLEKMREERIKYRTGHTRQLRERSDNGREQRRAKLLEHRGEFRRHRAEQAAHNNAGNSEARRDGLEGKRRYRVEGRGEKFKRE